MYQTSMSFRNGLSFGIIFVVCLVLAVVAGILGIADHAAQRASEQLSGWRGEVEKEDWHSAYELMTLATSLNPYQPVYRHWFARVYRVGAVNGHIERREGMALAMAHINRAIELRPEWPGSYAEKIWIRIINRWVDDDLDRALVAAVRYGPTDPDVIRVANHLGDRYYDLLSEEAQAAVHVAMANGVISYVPDIHEETLRVIDFAPTPLDDEVAGRLYTVLRDLSWRPQELPRLLETVDRLWDLWSPDQQSVLGDWMDDLVRRHRGFEIANYDVSPLKLQLCEKHQQLTCHPAP